MKLLLSFAACILLPLFLSAEPDVFTKNADIQLEKKFREHPHVLFTEKEIPALRKKLEHPYFKQFKADMIAEADYYLKSFSTKHVFPFSELPHYQLAAETLLSAWLITENPKYPERAIQWGLNFVNAHFLKIPKRTGKFKDYLGNDATYTLRPLALTYDILFNRMTKDEKRTFLKGLGYFGSLCQKMTENNPEYLNGIHKNYRAGQMGAFGMIALAVEDELPDAAKWIETVKNVSSLWVNTAIHKDGMYPEGPTYFGYTGEHILLLYAALERREKKELLKHTNMYKTVDWLTWSLLPWGYEFDNFSDGNYVFTGRSIPALYQHFNPLKGNILLNLAYGKNLRYTGNAAWSWLYLNQPDDSGRPEKIYGNGAVFKYGGMAAFNDGWNPNAAKVFFYATNYKYAAHSQADRGQFNFYSGGNIWAADSGYGNDGKQENSATSADAHSQVFIDGKGQPFAHQTRVSGTFSHIKNYVNAKSFGYASADLKDAYSRYVWYTKTGGDKVWNPVEKAVRHLLFMRGQDKPSYLLVYDDIRKDSGKHLYSWRMQTASTNILQLKGKDAEIHPISITGDIVYAEDSGSWDKPASNGFRLFRQDLRFLTFEIDSPESGVYYLWILGCNNKLQSTSEAELYVNGKSAGRLAVAPFTRPSWSRFTLNKNKMGEPEAVSLQKGKNIIEFRNAHSGYIFKKGIFVSSKEITPDKLEQTEKKIEFDASSLTKSKHMHQKTADAKNNQICSVKVLSPENFTMKKDYFQPSAVPMHPRLIVETEAVEPDFLVMLHPHSANGEQPEIRKTRLSGGIPSVELKWKNGKDTIIRNPHSKTFTCGTIRTDAKILVFRENISGAMEILAAECSDFQKNGKQFCRKKDSTLIGDGKIMTVSDFIPEPIPTDSLP